MLQCDRQTGTSEEWAERYEELELAARVASRRAAAAEAELHRLKQQLEAADKRAKELAWQVRAWVLRSHLECSSHVLV